MSETLGRKAYNIDQPAGFTLVNSGPALALGTNTKGKDAVSEITTVQTTNGNQFPSINVTVSEAVTGLTVV